MNEFDQKIYKEYTIDKFEHPALFGKYELHNKLGKFIGRYRTLRDCRDAIDKT